MFDRRAMFIKVLDIAIMDKDPIFILKWLRVLCGEGACSSFANVGKYCF